MRAGQTSWTAATKKSSAFQRRDDRCSRESALLTAGNVSFAYEQRVPVLHGVSLDASSDDIVGLLGPNGSGKTTLLNVLAGILPADAGDIALDGRALAAWPRAALARRMSVVPQETHLAFDYSVLEIVLMGRYSHLGAFELEG